MKQKKETSRQVKTISRENKFIRTFSLTEKQILLQVRAKKVMATNRKTFHISHPKSVFTFHVELFIAILSFAISWRGLMPFSTFQQPAIQVEWFRSCTRIFVSFVFPKFGDSLSAAFARVQILKIDQSGVFLLANLPI